MATGRSAFAGPVRPAGVVAGLFAALSLFLGQAPSPAECAERGNQAPRRAGPGLAVALRDGSLSVDVRDQPWSRLIEELVRQTGIVLHVHPWPGGSVTASLPGFPVEYVLKRLFGPGAQYVFRYEPAGSQPGSPSVPAEVWVLGVQATPTTAAAALAGRTPADPTAPRHSAEQVFRPTVTALLVGLRDPDADGRLQAVTGLGDVRDDSTVDVLEQLLVADPDREVRAAAAAALIKLGASRTRTDLRETLDEYELVRTRALAAAMDPGDPSGSGTLESSPTAAKPQPPRRPARERPRPR